VDASADGVVVRRSEHGWQVGDGQAADLTSAMVLADLLAADLGAPAPSSAGLAGPRRSAPVTEELARKQPPPRKRGRSPRHARPVG